MLSYLRRALTRFLPLSALTCASYALLAVISITPEVGLGRANGSPAIRDGIMHGSAAAGRSDTRRVAAPHGRFADVSRKSTADNLGAFPPALAQKAAATAPRKPGVNCVQYVRAVSDVELRGDGWMWWGRAGDRYERGAQPQPGAIMVFKRTKSMVHGHVAIVSQVIDERFIRIDHANWAPRGGLKGRVDADVMVQDISNVNDWSVVRVWYAETGQFGRPYPVYGFVYSPIGGASNQKQVITTPIPAALMERTLQSREPNFLSASRVDAVAHLVQDELAQP